MKLKHLDLYIQCGKAGILMVPPLENTVDIVRNAGIPGGQLLCYLFIPLGLGLAVLMQCPEKASNSHQRCRPLSNRAYLADLHGSSLLIILNTPGFLAGPQSKRSRIPNELVQKLIGNRLLMPVPGETRSRQA